MTQRFDAVVGLDRVAPPNLIEVLSETDIINRLLDAFTSAFPQFADNTDYEPVRALLHVAAAQELNLRQRINDAAGATLLATAALGDLDVHGAGFGMTRNIITPADDEAVPPVPAVMESDAAFRARIQLAWEGLSVAGPAGAYVFWALSVNGVRDARVMSPSPAVVDLYILSTAPEGEADQALIEAVHNALEDKRPVADRLSVKSAEPIDFMLEANLTLRDGPAADIVLAEAEAGFKALLNARYPIGQSLPLSALHSALTVPGVQRVDVVSPAGGLDVQPHQFARLAGAPLINIV